MSRYIKFDDAVKVMACEMYAEAQSQGYDVDGIEDFMPEAKAWLNDAPTIDAVEVVRGEWIDKPTKGVRYICSRCRGRFDYQWKYCPNCGARMKGADDDNND